MRLTKTVVNPKEVTAPEWYTEAVTIISSSKSRGKWRRPVSKSFYEKLCADAINAMASMGMEQKDFDYFIHDTLDYYIDHGYLKPSFSQYVWEIGLFHAFKRLIDAAICRRARSVRAAAERRMRKEAEAADVAEAPVAKTSVREGHFPAESVDERSGRGVENIDSTAAGILLDSVVGLERQVHAQEDFVEPHVAVD